MDCHLYIVCNIKLYFKEKYNINDIFQSWYIVILILMDFVLYYKTLSIRKSLQIYVFTIYNLAATIHPTLVSSLSSYYCYNIIL